ncbi:pilus assembly protein TadG [Vibrio pectenicida]|uniref:TadE/TadG family type IV pilus assembly protein n=1 Tax=Vibrio pectenicida TaxID=62763 RepID=UPI003B99B949
MKGYLHQKGAAGALFLCVLPLMIGLLVFCIQVAQQLQAHSKLTEATEVASLALAARTEGSPATNKEYAERIVTQYIDKTAKKIDIYIDEKKCDYSDGCVQKSGEIAPYKQVNLSASSYHDSWLSYEPFNLKPEFNVAGKSVSHRYIPQPMDVYFILDVSDSMNLLMKGGKKRIDTVKLTIERFVDYLRKLPTEKKSRVALLAYGNVHVKESLGPPVVIRNGSQNLHWQKKIVYEYDNEDAQKTVESMFSYFKIVKEIKGVNRNMSPHDIDAQINENNEIEKKYPFYDIPLTDQYNEFKRRLKGIPVKGSTQSWQGIIAAAQEAYQVKDDERNPEQVFIVLSDGKDMGYGRNNLKYYVDNGLCKKLKSKISNKPNRFTRNTSQNIEPTKVRMAVIGVDFQPVDNSGFTECFGNNIVKAEDGDEIYKYILNLINEESGNLRG